MNCYLGDLYHRVSEKREAGWCKAPPSVFILRDQGAEIKLPRKDLVTVAAPKTATGRSPKALGWHSFEEYVGMLMKYPDPLKEVERWPRNTFFQNDIELAAEEAVARKNWRINPSWEEPMATQEAQQKSQQAEKHSPAKKAHTSNGDTVLSQEEWLGIYADPTTVEQYLKMSQQQLEESLDQLYREDSLYAAAIYALYLREKGEIDKYDFIMEDLDQLGNDSSWEAFKGRIDCSDGDI